MPASRLSNQFYLIPSFTSPNLPRPSHLTNTALRPVSLTYMTSSGTTRHCSKPILIRGHLVWNQSETENNLKSQCSTQSTSLAPLTVPLTTQIKLLGVTLDQSLTFDSHIMTLSKTCFYKIRALRHNRPILSEHKANLICVIASSLVWFLPDWTIPTLAHLLKLINLFKNRTNYKSFKDPKDHIFVWYYKP